MQQNFPCNEFGSKVFPALFMKLYMFYTVFSPLLFNSEDFLAGENLGEWGGENLTLGKLCASTSQGKPGEKIFFGI